MNKSNKAKFKSTHAFGIRSLHWQLYLWLSQPALSNRYRLQQPIFHSRFALVAAVLIHCAIILVCRDGRQLDVRFDARFVMFGNVGFSCAVSLIPYHWLTIASATRRTSWHWWISGVCNATRTHFCLFLIVKDLIELLSSLWHFI